MTETTYQRMKREADEAVEPKPAVRRRVKRDPEVAKARQAEKTRRYQESRRRSHIVLVSRHEDEFEEILAAERTGVDEERGPLPGDESEES